MVMTLLMAIYYEGVRSAWLDSTFLKVALSEGLLFDSSRVLSLCIFLDKCIQSIVLIYFTINGSNFYFIWLTLEIC